jgi:LDH2 family malate/lactate/ureidoglycolate dehydrogenase
VADGDAESIAELMIEADLQGADGHGIFRLPQYIRRIQAGGVNPRPRIRVERERAAMALVNGDNGMGHVVMRYAARLAIEKARGAGCAWVGVRWSNHAGPASLYARMPMREGMIGMYFAVGNANHLPPWGGVEMLLSTNPIAVAIPAGSEPPIVLDMATSTASFGKVEIAMREGKAIPLGWAIDRDGYPTTDPRAMLEGGALLPLGSDREGGGHKGYGLALAADVLSAVLSGANWGPFAPPFALRQPLPQRSVGKGIGHFFGAMRVDAFRDLGEFKAAVDEFARTLRATRPAPGTSGPLVPGDPEREAQEERDVRGVPVLAAVLEDLREISRQTGVGLD